MELFASCVSSSVPLFIILFVSIRLEQLRRDHRNSRKEMDASFHLHNAQWLLQAAEDWYDDKKNSKENLRQAVEQYRHRKLEINEVRWSPHDNL